jgi:hypothetical protein
MSCNSPTIPITNPNPMSSHVTLDNIVTDGRKPEQFNKSMRPLLGNDMVNTFLWQQIKCTIMEEFLEAVFSI